MNTPREWEEVKESVKCILRSMEEVEEEHWTNFGGGWYTFLKAKKKDFEETLHDTLKDLVSTIEDKTREEERERVRKLLPRIEVMRDKEKGAFALRYNIGDDYTQTMLIDQDIAEEAAIDIVLKVVKRANGAYSDIITALNEKETN